MGDYTVSGFPVAGSTVLAGAWRAEFALVEAAFDAREADDPMHWLLVHAKNIQTASDDYVVTPFAGTITKIIGVHSANIDTDTTYVMSIGGVTVTAPTIVFLGTGTYGSTMAEVVPTANNIVTAGQAIKLAGDGGSSNNGDANFFIEITKT